MTAEEIRKQILEADDLQREVVETPEWPVQSVIVQELDASTAEGFWLSARSEDGSVVANFRAHVVAHHIVDENGDQVFSVEDVEALAKKSNRPISRIYKVAEKMLSLNRQSVEEAAKN